MRKFIISDIHGFGNLYYSIMGYLDNISMNEKVELYINGDLIDRGLESAEILLDIKNRMKKNRFRIIYLGGNHELLMYQEYKRREMGLGSYFNDWYLNGGNITDDGLYDKLRLNSRILEVNKFISNLTIYHKFKEKIDDKNIVLVHASCPLAVSDRCHLKIKNDNNIVMNCVWERDEDKIGNDNYFTIIGHTPNDNYLGYVYNNQGNYLNIDGGAAPYVCGRFYYNHFPLVEVKNGYLKILTFNDQNEIVYGNYFNGNSYSYTNNELNKEREFLNHKLKTKKLSINEDGVVSYW